MGRDWFWRFIEFGQSLREGIGGLVYGDQGLVVARDLFLEAGGYPDQPVMEDVELFRRLRHLGKVRKIPAPILTSPRRYREEGRWRGWLRNAAIIFLYAAGFPPEKLARFYRPRRTGKGALEHPGRETPAPAGLGAPDPSLRRTLLIFAKEPVPGRVKTRLAARVGPEEAARIYRELGRRVVDQLRDGPYETAVCFDPPEGREAVAAWLGGRGLTFRPQCGGDLGSRLSAAFREAFETADQAVVVGTDAPGVDRELVTEAFRRLGETPLVLGPATDGGYYLLGLAGPAPELFRDIPWSTEGVLDATKDRARSLGLTPYLLPALPDVDTLEDWEEVSAATP